LVKHKKWIKSFQNEISQKKNDAIDEGLKEEIKKIKVKELAQKMRDDIRSGNFEGNPKYANSLYKTKHLRPSEIQLQTEMNDDQQMQGIELDDAIGDEPHIVDDRKPQIPRLDYQGQGNIQNLKADQDQGRITYVRPEETNPQLYNVENVSESDKYPPQQQKIISALKKGNLKKKVTPAYAMTEQQALAAEDEECDE